MTILRTLLVLALTALGVQSAYAQATQLPLAESCFSGSTGVTGSIGLLGTITGGSSYVTGTYGGVPLTGGSGTGANANITISGGAVTGVAILNPGSQYQVGDVLSASNANLGGAGSGFSFPVASIGINSNLAGGSVGFYVPNTFTFKTTWRNATQSTPNTNPVLLDANGCAVIYGIGSYRQIVKDSIGNTVWDQVTTAPASSSITPATSGAGDFLPVGAVIAISGFSSPVNYVLAYGQPLSRTIYPDALSALTFSSTATCVSSSTTIGGISSTLQLRTGSSIESSCLPPGTTIVGITTANSILVSAPATLNTSTSIRVFPWGNGDGSTTFNVPDLRGLAPAGADAMGGTPANRLTPAYFNGVAGGGPAAPGARGGLQTSSLINSNLPPYTPTGTINTPSITISGGTLGGTANKTDVGGGGTSSTPLNATAISASLSASLAFTGTAQGGTSSAFSIIQPTLTINYAVKIQNGTLPIVGVLSLGGMTGDILCGPGVTCSGQTISFNGGAIPLTTNHLFVGSAGNVAVDVPMFGDCTIVAAGAITCLRTNGTPFGGMATQAASNVAITGGFITGMPNPSASSDVATKNYVDAATAGRPPYASVNLATTTALPNSPTYSNGASGVGATLTAGSNTTLTVDGSVATLGQRILAGGQSSTFQNGVYTVTTAGSGAAAWVLTRATDFNQSSNMLQGASFFTSGGSANVGKTFTLSATTTTVGTTPVVFFLTGGSGTTIAGVSGNITLQSGLAVTGSTLNIPGTVTVTDPVFAAACDGSTEDSTPITNALSSGAGVVTIPNSTCNAFASGSITIPASVKLQGLGPSSRLRLPTVTHSATGSVALNVAVIPMTNTTGIVTGMYAYDRTLGYLLPGTVTSINPGVSITMTTPVGYSGSVQTNALTLATDPDLHFATLGVVTAQNGMSAYDTDKSCQVGGTVLDGTPYTDTTITMSTAVGCSGIASGDHIQFGYPVTSGDVIVFSASNSVLLKLSAGSQISNLTIDMGEFAGGNSSGAISTVAGVVDSWIIDNVKIINAGLYCWVYNGSTNYRITNSSCIVNVPSNKNNNEAILSYSSGGTVGGLNGFIWNNVFTGAGTDQSEQNVEISFNKISNIHYGAGITSGGASALNFNWLITQNIIHGGVGVDSNLTAPLGIGSFAQSQTISLNEIYNMGGPGIIFGGIGTKVSANVVYNNGQSALNLRNTVGIWCRYIDVTDNCSHTSTIGNTSGNIGGSSQTYGYLDDASNTDITLLSNTFYNNATGNAQLNASNYAATDIPAPWTPTISFNISNSGLTYASHGLYTKINQHVSAHLDLQFSPPGIASASGNASIGGFPGGGAITGSSIFPALICGSYTGLHTAQGITGVMSATSLTLYIPGASAIANATEANFGASSTLDCSISYPSLN